MCGRCLTSTQHIAARIPPTARRILLTWACVATLAEASRKQKLVSRKQTPCQTSKWTPCGSGPQPRHREILWPGMKLSREKQPLIQALRARGLATGSSSWGENLSSKRFVREGWAKTAQGAWMKTFHPRVLCESSSKMKDVSARNCLDSYLFNVYHWTRKFYEHMRMSQL